MLPAQGDKKCDEAVGYVCEPDNNVCWQELLGNGNGNPYGWSANVSALTTPGSVTTVRFV